MIEVLAGVFLTPDDADYIARALDLLRKQLRANNAAPSAKLDMVTERIARSAANARVPRRNASPCVSHARAHEESAEDPVYGWITTAEAARILGCTPGNVRDRARRKTLPAHLAGGRWVYPAEAIIRLAEHR
ncbi:helix-turn-helix domain-containing protein [Nocardia otitidiscaviarum]|uniref:helix-turn-helix domain-containing protein n=1 Tax=Nocardia otitidiscaviarum TaxID=1823 RepID=UPI00245712CB|nr:helix-turn-helix domain-containing protein [Nocardia otitidiscaviarum]